MIILGIICLFAAGYLWFVGYECWHAFSRWRRKRADARRQAGRPKVADDPSWQFTLARTRERRARLLGGMARYHPESITRPAAPAERAAIAGMEAGLAAGRLAAEPPRSPGAAP